MPKRQTTITLSVVLALALIVAATAMFNHQQDTAVTTTPTKTTTTAPATTGTTSTPTTTSGTTSSSSSYKDGTYSETGSYSSPGGTESIKVSVTLKNGVVTATSATGNANDGESQEYQDDFITGYKSLVVGKKVDEISLSRVSGSSLTSDGFNSALTKIKADATA